MNLLPQNTRYNILFAFRALSKTDIMVDEFGILMNSSLVEATLGDIMWKWEIYNLEATRRHGLYQRLDADITEMNR